MSSRAFDLALAGSKGVKVLPDLTAMPAVNDVVSAGSIVNNEEGPYRISAPLIQAIQQQCVAGSATNGAAETQPLTAERRYG